MSDLVNGDGQPKLKSITIPKYPTRYSGLWGAVEEMFAIRAALSSGATFSSSSSSQSSSSNQSISSSPSTRSLRL